MFRTQDYRDFLGIACRRSNPWAAAGRRDGEWRRAFAKNFLAVRSTTCMAGRDRTGKGEPRNFVRIQNLHRTSGAGEFRGAFGRTFRA
jgi:hypothetical protein